MVARAARRLIALAAGALALGALAIEAVASAGAANAPHWSLQATPNPTGPFDSELFGVSCASVSFCMAVGYAEQGAARTPLAERFDGTRWRLQAVTAPPGAVTADFIGVSCVGTRSCVAVGDYRNRHGLTLTLAERWNGVAWSIEATPDPGHPYARATLDSGTEFSGVSCGSASSCVAVGDYLDRKHRSVALVERRRGAHWTLEPSPAARGRQLGSTSCATATACTIVGEYRRGFGVLVPTAERSLAGPWMLERAPASAVPGSMTSILVSVSCVSSSRCTAVGERSTAAGGNAAFAERLRGGSWTITPTPLQTEAVLGGVSCATALACTAVGLRENSTRSSTLPLIERWNGRSWAIEAGAALARGRRAGGLGAVSCVSRSRCVAVGFATYDAGGVERTLTLAEQRR
ncbi:MAG TPA: hypothetical protein VGG41_00685 [Solirubrobacteraceae bacterium]